LPKGGGAIRDIGEKFGVNSATGSGSMSVPIVVSEGRGGAQPTLSLSYNSGSGNGIFGLGWSCSLPLITRKTDKGIPRYGNDVESDVYIMLGEDLVPWLKRDQMGNYLFENGKPIADEQIQDGFAIRKYSPRIESDFASIERCSELANPDNVYWRTIGSNNLTSIYGRDDDSRITGPSKNQIFSWLLSEMYDVQGNAVKYSYKSEDSVNIPIAPNERNRVQSANRYIKKIQYGNRIPNRDTNWSPYSTLDLPDDTWMFSVVFDYGEHNPIFPTTMEDSSWTCRADPFSSYRSSFQIRTYRLCQKILMFHHFPLELGVQDYLVSSTDLFYDQIPTGTYLTQVVHTGYILDQNHYVGKSFPPVEFTYSRFPTDLDLSQLPISKINPHSLRNLPAGVDGSLYQWLDLDGEGSSGVFVEQDRTWYYKRNISASNLFKGPKFGPLEIVGTKPLPSLSQGDYKFADLSGGGHINLVEMGQSKGGFYKRNDFGWNPYQEFKSIPNLDFKSPEVKFIDINGDGLVDILVSEDQAFQWYSSLGEDGYAEGERTFKSPDEEKGPKLIFGDPEQTIYLADMSGDGLTDILRIRNGNVCYWPNLGYGRFGPKVTMDNGPWFDRSDQFNQKFIRVADIDGTGTTDILYLKPDGVDIYLNLSGNGFSDRKHVPLPPIDNVTSVSTVDLFGTGTVCLVWSSPLCGNQRTPMKYVDLTNGVKPNLLIKAVNNLGAETRIHYAPSTKFYLEDKEAGRPWITKLPFPVHCVHKIETFDHLSRNHFSTVCAYHHGSFDAYEREFRGFAMVEQWDTEDFLTNASAVNIDETWHVPPMHTKTWFHTGVYIDNDEISRHLAYEYFGAPSRNDTPAFGEYLKTLLDDTVLPEGLSDITQVREACRSLKGHVLRKEIYADDGTEKATLPYAVTESNYTIELLQAQPDFHLHSSFTVHPREALTYNLERNLDDPRVEHELTLQVDPYGHVLKSVKVAYGRVIGKSPLIGNLRSIQERPVLIYNQNEMTNIIMDRDNYLLPEFSENRTYELYGFKPQGSTRFRREDFAMNDFAPLLSLPEIPFEASGDDRSKQKRLIEHTRVLYRRNDLSGLLPLGQIESMGISGEEYHQYFTSGLFTKAFSRSNGGTSENLMPNPGQLLGGTGGNQGGYTDLESNGNWWAPSGRSYFDADPGSTPSQELAEGRKHFFRERRRTDQFEQHRIVEYDSYDFLVIRMIDPIGNSVLARNDYRVLQPDLITDSNLNQTQCAFDEFGRVSGTAVMGKASESLGDSLDGFRAVVSQDEVDQFMKDPKGPIMSSLLGNATTRCIYNIWRYSREPDVNKKLPSFNATISREKHASDPVAGELKTQVTFTYSDGFGREIQKKVQAEPGPVAIDGPIVSMRWMGTGWTIYNNKGSPVKRYEPFFDESHEFIFDHRVGVSPTTFYDPLGRIVAVLNPNHTYTKSTSDSWQLTAFDVHDTILQSPESDPDVGGYFRLIPDIEYSPTWYNSRINGQLGPIEKSAAIKASAHANTATVTHLDPLGRKFLSIVDNGSAGKYSTFIVFDIQGNQREIIDAQNRSVMRYQYNMVQEIVHQASFESGERWVLNDVLGKPICLWNSRNQQIRNTYDVLRRPILSHLQDGMVSDVLVERKTYGESRTDPENHNARSQVYQTFDQAGIVTNQEFDFKGNLLKFQRQFAKEYKRTLDWTNEVPLENSIHNTATSYDALDRLIQRVTPDNTAVRQRFNEAGFIESVQANLRGGSSPVSLVNNIDYNAKGQRIRVEYGNDSICTYSYDAVTLRLTGIRTTRGSAFQDCPRPAPPGWSGCQIQNLLYTYDAIGNIIYTQDTSQQRIFFRNQRVDSDNEYTYDPLYRLIEASGREHLAQANDVINPSARPDYNSRFDLPGDGKAMSRYFEKYTYDSLGNILSLQHGGADSTSPGWTRQYFYREPSQLETGKINNRLSRTTIGSTSQNYNYEGLEGKHGNITRMSNIGVMRWNYKDQLSGSEQQIVNGGTPESTFYVYNSNGERVRKVTERQAAVGQTPTILKQRIYLGGFEMFRSYNPDGSIRLERETLRVMDDKQPVALVETRIQGDDGPGIPAQVIRYQCTNHLGSVHLELDDQGQIISYEEYTAYGVSSYQAPKTRKRYRYTGKELDRETGLYYYGSRYYSATIGRWISCDPGSLSDGMNLYVYVHCNPINQSDPNGGESSWLNRALGAVTVVGGVLEIAAGVAGLAAPTGVTQVLGAVALVHGADTLVAGLRTAWTGESQKTFTEQGATAAAKGLGASEKTAERVGMAVDMLAGAAESIGGRLVKKAAVEGATEAARLGKAAAHATEEVATHAAPKAVGEGAEIASHAAPEAAEAAAHAAPEAAEAAAHAAPEAASAVKVAPDAAEAVSHAAPAATKVGTKAAGKAASKTAAKSAAKSTAKTVRKVKWKRAGSPNEWHHLFIKDEKWVEFFRKMEINVHEFGVEIPEALHSKIHAAGWNKEWEKYILKMTKSGKWGTLTKKDVWNKMMRMKRKYGLSGYPMSDKVYEGFRVFFKK
jgi:RHS repeat-associated protein